jgi:signal transduction histidine kinase
LIVQRRELTDALEAKAAELQQVNDQLRQANELKTAFIQVASHELRTPLAILAGYSELSSRAPDVRDPLKDWIKRIATAAKRLQYLVNQMIDMLQAGQFQATLHLQPTDLASLLDEAVADVEPFILLRHQTLKREWPADIGTIDLDAPKIRDSLNHILLNAIKFTPDNGAITVSAVRTDDAGVRIAISDTGCGIDAAHLPRIGEAFFTGYDVARHSSGHYEHGRKGLGLGVSVVKKFLEMHRGQVEVQSEVGCGTTVTLTLPAGAASPSSVPQPA